MSDSTVPVAQPGQGESAPFDEPDRAGEVADGLIRDFHPVTALDLGSGDGQLVAALRARGVDASGIDASEPIAGRYDLIACIDVLEGLPAADAEKAVADLCAAADTIVLSVAATPEDWAAKLAERGFMRSLDRDLSYVSPTAAAFVRGEEDRAETVRRYDRAWWQLRSEVAEVRRALQEQRQRLSELESEAEAADALELAEMQTELLRLRDLLIGKDAELGVAVGKVAELETRAGWITALKHRRNLLRGAIAKIPGAKSLKRLIRRR
jgi:hypothetical protein